MAIDPAGRYSGVLAFFEAVQRKPGQFTPKLDAAQKIRATLDQAKVDNSFQRFYVGIANQLEGIRQGAVKPKEDWELTAGFYQAQGVPYRVTVEGGKPVITAQVDDPMDDKTPQQRAAIRRAVESLDGIFKAQDELNTKVRLNITLADAVDRLGQIKQLAIPKTAWEFEARRFYQAGTPFQIALDAEGNITVRDQSKELFNDRPVVERNKLRQAVSQWNAIRNGTLTATELWQFEALGNRQANDDFYIDLNDAGEVVLRRNNFNNVLPEFLELQPNEAVSTEFPWQRQALELYAQGKGFFLDTTPNGTGIVVKENNYANIAGLTDPNRARNVQAAGLFSLLT